MLFVELQTQWRIGPAGPTGLDYAAIPFALRLRGVPRAQHAAVFDDLRVMELETLRLVSEARRKESK